MSEKYIPIGRDTTDDPQEWDAPIVQLKMFDGNGLEVGQRYTIMARWRIVRGTES